MMFVNLTPHSINIRTASGAEIVVNPSGIVARVATIPGECLGFTHEEGIALFSSTSYGEVEGVPESQSGTIYIVSAMVAARCFNRGDVFSPGTGPQDGAIRNDKGHVVAVTRLIQAPKS